LMFLLIATLVDPMFHHDLTFALIGTKLAIDDQMAFNVRVAR
jgi:hypothetical protein